MSAYCELHAHSNFSLLDGASHPAELVARAAELGMSALALTDHDAVYGAVRFRQAAHAAGIQPVLGAELTLCADDNPDRPFHLTLLVEGQAGWHNLCYLISRARHGRSKGEALLPFSELTGCTQGLIALSGCRKGELAQTLRRGGDHRQALAVARRYLELFGRENYWIELQRHYLPDDDYLIQRQTALARYLQLGCVATNNVHYATPDRQMLQDILVCIRHLTPLDAATPLRRLNAEYYLKSAEAMAALFPGHSEALANTLRLAERCRFDLRYGLQDLPHFPAPHGMSSGAYLRRLCQEALPLRYGIAPSRVQTQLAHELRIIETAGLANYFLIVWDIVRYARENGIRCQGRGSAANSLVAYLLHISPIDPIAHDLVFERFLSAERQVVPDIDIDFDAARREEVIQYVYDRYGADHTAMACTFVTFRRRSAIRDVGKALNLAPEVIAEALAQEEGLQDDRGRTTAGARSDQQVAQPAAFLLQLADQLHGFPRHLGIHSGGMIITGAPLMGRVPTEPATMADRVVVQWDKEALEAVGLVKIDILGLRMLSAITDALALLQRWRPEIELPETFDDTAVYDMIGSADTVGVFQVESRAQAQVLPRLQPRRFGDLVVSISLIRPGPIQGNMVHPYLRRREGIEPVTYLHPLLEPALAETLGVILFQEQVLKVARDLAGFTAGQGEQLRRALGAKNATDAIAAFHDAFIAGAQANDVDPATAETVFEQLLAFGGYSFAKSHAAAFAVLVYQSAWLKRYHFAAFYTALLNNQPMGFWNAAVLVNEIRRQGATVLPVDIHVSEPACTAGPEGIRLGFNYVKGLRATQIEVILTEREARPFTNLSDFCRRTRLARSSIETLITAGAMDGWSVPRRHLLWELGTLDYREDTLDLAFAAAAVRLPELTPAEAMLAEQEVMGLSPGDHVMTFLRARLRKADILGSAEVALATNGAWVRVAGLLVVHQSPPTAKGFHFLTLEDEDGMLNVIVRPRIVARHGRMLRSARLLLVAGEVQQQGGVTNVLAEHIAVLRVDVDTAEKGDEETRTAVDN